MDSHFSLQNTDFLSLKPNDFMINDESIEQENDRWIFSPSGLDITEPVDSIVPPISSIENVDTDLLANTNNTVQNDNNTSVDPARNSGNIQILLQHIFKNPEPQEVNINDHIEIVSVHKCKLCESLFERYDDIIEHLKSCTKVYNNVYLCGLCPNSAGFKSLDTLRTHMLNDHQMKAIPEKKLECFETENGKVDAKYYQKLLANQKTAQAKVKCMIKGCQQKFASKEVMLKHLDCHYEGQKKKFKCNMCDKQFFVWRTCKNHMWNAHQIDIGLFECQICRKFKSLAPYNLLVHMKTHNYVQEAPSSALCSTCGKQFAKLAQLQNHVKTHASQTDEGGVTCTTCKNTFSNNKILKRHVQAVHAKYKPFICNICGHKSARKSMLELHLRQHTGEKPYKCDLCNFKTGDHNSFRRHTLRHSGLSSYSCPHCTYKTIQSTALKMHIKRKHPGKDGIYNCTNCPYSTVNAKLYENHLKKHNTKGPNMEPDNMDKMREKLVNIEDEETQIGLFSEHLAEDTTLDTGGITIPAET